VRAGRGIFLYLKPSGWGRIEVWLCGQACLDRYNGVEEEAA
jgi:hypothetical protein